VLDGIDKDIRLGAIKRPEEIRSMSDLQRVRDQRNKGEESVLDELPFRSPRLTRGTDIYVLHCP
jgi:hypothetical protein